MNFAKYNAITLEWKKQYPCKPIIEPYDPTKTLAGCIRCGSTRKLSRHHIANDFWFACLRPDLYAARYIQFRKEDVVLLCDRCHKLVHTHYRKLMELVKDDLHKVAHNNNFCDWLHEYPSKEWCDYWKQQFRDWFAKWIKKPYTKRKRRKRGNRRRKL